MIFSIFVYHELRTVLVHDTVRRAAWWSCLFSIVFLMGFIAQPGTRYGGKGNGRGEEKGEKEVGGKRLGYSVYSRNWYLLTQRFIEWSSLSQLSECEQTDDTKMDR